MTRLVLVTAAALALAACKSDPPATKQAPSASSSGATPSVTAPIRGHLSIWLDGQEFGFERYEDDGKALKSQIFMGDAKSEIVITRSPRHILSPDTKKLDSDIPDGAFPAWVGGRVFAQRYALLAEWFPSATAPAPIKLIGVGGALEDGTVTVTGAEAGKRVELNAPWGTVMADVAPTGHVTHWTNGESGATALEGKSAPDAVDEELVEVDRAGVKLRGSLWLPKGARGPVPVVVMIAGSGPTDRDGNGPVGHLRTNVYRLLAEELAKNGIASLRYDKRAVGQSGKNFNVPGLVFSDFVDDAAAVFDFIRKDKRLGRLTAMGHSEGGMILSLAAAKVAPDALIYVNTVGRIWWKLIQGQLAAQLDAKTMQDYDRAVVAIRAGKPAVPLPAVLEPLIGIAQQVYFRSEMDVDPAENLGKLTIPTVIMQGETDAQTTVEDAKLLTGKRPDAKFVLLARTNHVLKEEAVRSAAQASYNDATKPLAPGVVEAFLAAVKR